MKRILVTVLLLFASHLMAQLTWEQTELEATAKDNETAVKASFKFKNSGQTPITITRLQASCGCTTADLAKKDYAPGEEGVVGATMQLPTDGGRRRKTITVFTNEADNKTYVLAQSIENLHWFTGDPVASKEVTLKAAPGHPVKVKSATSDRDQFSVKLTTVTEGMEYKLTVMPKDTTGTVNAIINLETDLPKDLNDRQRIFARVLAPLPIPPK
jgi:hypothetical protein